MTPWTVDLQAPLNMGFSRPEYWNGEPFLSPEDLPDPGIEPRPHALQADSLPSKLQGRSETLVFYKDWVPACFIVAANQHLIYSQIKRKFQ